MNLPWTPEALLCGVHTVCLWGLLSYLSEAGCTEPQGAHKLTHAHQNAQSLLNIYTSRHTHSHIQIRKHKTRHMIDCFFSNAEFELSWSEVVYNIISLQTTEHTHIHFHQCYKHITQSSSNVYIINCHNFFLFNWKREAWNARQLCEHGSYINFHAKENWKFLLFETGLTRFGLRRMCR